MDVLADTIQQRFWSKWFWLPERMTWTDYANGAPDGIYHPQLRDLFASLPTFVLCVIVIRLTVERFIAPPIGRRLGIKDENNQKAAPNLVLEAAFQKNRTPNYENIQGLAKQTDMSPRQVERWFRQRKKQFRVHTLKRFGESCWRFIYYSVMGLYGLKLLSTKEWFWDSKQCWVNYPHQHVSSDVYFYFMVELGYYVSSSIMHFTDVRKKDFWELFLHHIFTMLLMFMSWVQNMVRIATLVLLVHDLADPFLEATKMMNYCRKTRLCNRLFIMFTFVWYLTRMMIYPWKILYSTLFLAHPVVGFAPIYYVYNGLLGSLQLLHLIWSVIITKMLLKLLETGKISKDARSETDDDIAEEENKEKPILNNSM